MKMPQFWDLRERPWDLAGKYAGSGSLSSGPVSDSKGLCCHFPPREDVLLKVRLCHSCFLSPMPQMQRGNAESLPKEREMHGGNGHLQPPIQRRDPAAGLGREPSQPARAGCKRALPSSFPDPEVEEADDPEATLLESGRATQVSLTPVLSSRPAAIDLQGACFYLKGQGHCGSCSR